MNVVANGFTLRLTAKIAGGAYLVVIVAALFAEAVVRGSIVDYQDAAETARNIASSEALYRGGLAADMIAMLAYTIVTALFYGLFKPVSRTISLTAAFLSLVGIAISGAVALLHYAPLSLLQGQPYLQTVPTDELQALALLSLKLHGAGYDISLVSFGLYCLLIGYLIHRSKFLPSALGVLMAFAGVGYLVNSFCDFLAIALPELVSSAALLPGLIGEGALTLWLLIVGVNQAKWLEQAGAPAEKR